MEFQRLVEKAARTQDRVARLRLWIDAVENARRPDYTRVLSPYTPPESTDIVRGIEDDRAAVYSFGVLGHAILSGTVHWGGGSTAELRRSIVSGRLPPIGLPGFSRAMVGRINRIIARATEKDPSARYKDREWLATELRGLVPTDADRRGKTVRYIPPIHDSAFREISRWLSDARSDPGECLMILGPSGIGKTYLWETVEDELRRAEETWAYAKAEQHDGRPYQIVAQILDRNRDVTGEIIESGEVSARVQNLVSVIIPSLARDDSRFEVVDVPGGLSPSDELADLLMIVLERTRTSVLCVDDYQWTDRFSRAVIARVSEADFPLPVAILSRDPVGDVATHCPHRLIELQPLDLEAARSFVATIQSPEDPVTENRFERAFSISRGNPLALTSAIRDDSVRSSFLATRDNVPDDVAVAVAQDRLRALEDVERRLVVLAALVGSPIPVSELRHAVEGETDTIAEAMEELESSFVFVRRRSDDVVRFAHDSIETAARTLANDEPELVRSAIHILVDRMNRGDDGAAYRAARLLSTTPEVDLPYRHWVLVFLNAARRSLRSLAPEEALRFADTGLRHVQGVDRITLLAVAHEAAYLKSDRSIMSRYYRQIAATGDSDAIAGARDLWLRRCYADERFRGASMIGRRILEGIRPGSRVLRWEEDLAAAERFLTTSSPRRVFRTIVDAGLATDRWTRLATDVLHWMYLPSLTNGAGEIAILAYYILTIAQTSGWSPLTGTGFVAWATYRAFTRNPGRWVRPHVRYAERLARMSPDPLASHSIRMLAHGLCGFWITTHDDYIARLERLEREGRTLGNWHFVAHCIHLGGQSRLWRGESLQAVRDRLDRGRREIRSFGLDRVDRALLKHQQTAETLLGYASDPLRLDGFEADEDSYLRSLTQSSDLLGLIGFWVAKSYLAVFTDRAEIAVDYFARIEEYLPIIGTFHDRAIVHFLWSLAAFRAGDHVLGTQQLRIVRKMERFARGSRRHRLRFLLGERAIAVGRSRMAQNHLRRAYTNAVEDRYIHEAGLIAERLAAVTADRSYRYLAWAHYREWGSSPAAERVAENLGEIAFSPGSLTVPTNDDEFVRAITTADSTATAIEETARRIAELTGAAQVYVHATLADDDELHLYYSEDRRSIRVERFPPDIALILSEVPVGEGRTTELRSGRSRPIPVVASRSTEVEGAVLSVLVLGVSGAAEYSSITRINVGAVIRSANMAMALLRMRERESLTVRDLGEIKQQLSETELYRRRLFRALPDAFLLVIRIGNVVYSNHVAERYILRDREGVTRFRDELREDMARLAEIPARDGRVVSERLPFNGGYVEVRVAPASEASEVDLLLAVSIRDVTETVEREQRIAQQDRQLVISDRLASIGMFSSAIVHEISNPNHILQLNTQSLAMVMSWLQAEVETESARSMVGQATELTEQIEEASRRVESVLRMVKSYGREGRGERWEMIDIAQVCERAFRFSRIMASQYTDRFRMHSIEALPRIRGERALLEQAIINLIKNACESLEDRHGSVELQAGLDSEDGGIAVSICDTGPGFPEDVQKNLGTPFMSGRTEQGGTGLGLSIVLAIVEKHQGRLSVSRDDTFRTRVTLHLPFASSDSQTPAETIL